jgi:O-antigen/teichoic acid export membrane protein
MNVAKRSITSVSWNTAANFVHIALGFARSVLLARLLPVEAFGVYGWAKSIVALSATFATFGMGGAFVHRAPETEDEEQTAAVHFTLQLVITIVWTSLLLGGTLVFASGQTRTVLLVLIATSVSAQLVQTPRLILARRVVHRRLALVQVINITLSTLVAVGLAWRGITLWALLSTDLVALLLNMIAFYFWKPVWRPRLTWSPQVNRYFLRFGSHNFLADVLLRALNRIDDLWTGVFLGEAALGLYSRAYTFATYPRRLLAAPINMVAGGTYAELQGDSLRLSRAFFRVNAFLIRSGFLLAGWLALAAPEFIRLMLGAKWLPMLDAFRLMLLFTLLDPIKVTVGALFIAVGTPETVTRARLAQLLILLAGLLILGPWLGIAGVALAVDLMLVVGIAILLRQARAYVTFSFKRLFIVPGLALVAGMILARRAIELPGILGSDWRTGFVKVAVFSAGYCAVLLALEHRQLFKAVINLSRRWA